MKEVGWLVGENKKKKREIFPQFFVICQLPWERKDDYARGREALTGREARTSGALLTSYSNNRKPFKALPPL